MNACCDSSNKLKFDINNIAQQDCDPDILCIATTNGIPQDNPPSPKNDIIRYDPCSKEWWLYTCDGGWQKVEFSFCSLDDIDLDVVPEPCDNLRLPVFYEFNGCCVQGYLDAGAFSGLVRECLGCPPEGADIVIGDNKQILYCDNGRVVKGPLTIDICNLLGNIGSPTQVSPGFGGSFVTLNPDTCQATLVTLPTETVTPPPNLPVFANARFNNGSASALAAIGQRVPLTGIGDNRFTEHQNDAAGVFTAVANGIRVNRTGWYIIVAQIRTNTFDASGAVPEGFHGECDGLFINGSFSGAHPNEEKNAAPAAGSTTTTSAWQIMSHNHVYLSAGDIYAPAATSLTHSVVWSGEVAMTFMGY